jgi:membrane protein implicated in regulation of membrane protease activity
MSDSSRGTDRLLVAEVLLALILFAIAVYFFVVPSASAPTLPPWWVGIVLAILFFAIVLLETYRRLGRQRAELRRTLEEDPQRSPDG